MIQKQPKMAQNLPIFDPFLKNIMHLEIHSNFYLTVKGAIQQIKSRAYLFWHTHPTGQFVNSRRGEASFRDHLSPAVSILATKDRKLC